MKLQLTTTEIMIEYSKAVLKEDTNLAEDLLTILKAIDGDTSYITIRNGYNESIIDYHSFSERIESIEVKNTRMIDFFNTFY